MKTFVRRYLCMGLVVAILAAAVALPSYVRAQDSGAVAIVSAATVNLRSGPGLDFNEVGAATANQRFPVLGRAHGSNRVWYKIQLPSGDTAWISERVVNISPSPDGIPWLSDNTAKTPLIMDCGIIPPVLFIGTYAQVTLPGGLTLYKDPGLGKTVIDSVAAQELVKVVDGPFCTRLDANFFQIQWLVVTGSNVRGYLFEGRPDGQGGYIPWAAISGNAGATFGSTLSSDPARPSQVADKDIQSVMDIFRAVQSRQIDQQETQVRLQAVLADSDAASLAWIVRHIPIYDGKVGRWTSFARYEDQTIMVFSDNSQLDLDPVTTAVDILFGNYTNTQQVWQMMGCGGG